MNGWIWMGGTLLELKDPKYLDEYICGQKNPNLKFGLAECSDVDVVHDVDGDGDGNGDIYVDVDVVLVQCRGAMRLTADCATKVPSTS